MMADAAVESGLLRLRVLCTMHSPHAGGSQPAQSAIDVTDLAGEFVIYAEVFSKIYIRIHWSTLDGGSLWERATGTKDSTLDRR